MKTSFQRKALATALIWTLISGFTGTARAELTDLSNVPLANSGSDPVLPNLMYILDDSGSMMWDYMPDNVQTLTTGTAINNCKTATGSTANVAAVQCALGNGTNTSSDGNTADWGEPPYFATQFNQIYYNPDIDYNPGVNSQGNTLGNATPTAAWKDAYLNTATTTDVTAKYPEVYYCTVSSTSAVTFTGRLFQSFSQSNNAGTTLAVDTSTVSGAIAVGMLVNAPGMLPGTVITASNGTTTNSGTTYSLWTVNNADKIGSSAMRAIAAAKLTDTTACRRNGVDNVQASPNNYFLYWSNNATTGTPLGAYPVATGTTSSTFNAQFVNVTGHPYYYIISPNEYCSDSNLVNCALANSNGSAPSGFSIPAPVRYCATTANASSASAVSDPANSTAPKCRAKFDVSNFRYPRYGRFTRVDIVPGTTTYAKGPNAVRPDCGGGSTCTYAQELQNFANWYSYYRVRMSMMKTSTGRAFTTIDDAYRVGFITINPVTAGSSVDGTNKYLPIATFDATQKASWYSYLYKQNNNGSTPLRTALARVGRHYGGVTTGINNGMSQDPVTASCQQNFSLLTTDGYWNDPGNPPDLTNVDIGNTDATEDTVAPIFVSRASGTLDGLGAKATTATPTTTIEQVVCNGNSSTAFSSGTQQACGCGTSTPLQTRIVQRTIVTTQSSTTTEGVSGGTTSGTTTTFTNITACTTPQVVTSTTPVTVVEEQVVSGNSQTTFSPINGLNTGANQAGACSSGQERVKRRTTTYTSTVVTTDGTAGAPTGSGTAYAFLNVGSCVTPLVVTTTTPVTETAQNVCTKNNNTGFSAANNGSNTQTACGCSTNNPTQSALKQRVLGYNHVVVTTDGAVTSDTLSANTSGPTITTPTACSTSAKTAAGTNVVNGSASVMNNGGGPTPVAAAPTTTNGATSNANNGGTTLTVTLSPNPQTSTGASTVTLTAGGTANTLADVAMYYYKTDLRTGATNPLAPNNVPNTTKDFTSTQHMTTFTLGLGLQGNMNYSADYETNPNSDFAKIKSAATGCDWSGAGTCDWPAPVAATPSALDDLWHAAVNGRGTYYSASDPSSLANGLSSALAALKIQTAAASASAVQAPNLTALSANLKYQGTFRTVKWDGEVTALRLDPTTGNVLANTPPAWTAQAQLDTMALASSDTRTIWRFNSGTGSKLQAFTWANLTGAEQAFFSGKCTALSQCATLTSTPVGSSQQDAANNGANMVAYLRGQSGNTTTASPLFRARDHVLGDPVNGTPIFIGPPSASFVDSGYSAFKSGTAAARQGVLYVPANDGMLHAFNGDTGVEMWAYVPRIVFPNMYKLATDNWDVKHQYLVDGSPQSMDVFDTTAGAWKTMLVGGLGGGGRGFFALDVTDPTNPKGMWEICADSALCAISDPDIGDSYGNAVITKRVSDGKWVVLISSGMNNVPAGTQYAGATGRGFLFVLDAITGAVLRKVDTATGDTVTPSGFSKFSAMANSPSTDNTTLFVYGGDLLGDLWRFDMSQDPPAILLMATLKDSSGKPQSITTRPELGAIKTNTVVFVGTGRYLGTTDLVDPATLTPPEQWAYQQSFYALKDKGTSYGDPRSASPGLVQQTITDTGTNTRTISALAVDWTNKDGWFVDFNPGNSSPGERDNLDPFLVQGTLLVTTNVPNNTQCTVGGDSWQYQFDYTTGSYVASAPGGMIGQKTTGQIMVGVTVVQTTSGNLEGHGTGSGGQDNPFTIYKSGSGGGGKRVSWRELLQ